MKCAEVMEWMHRYLDQDLSQDEIVEMFRHIDDCPSCAEVFERLTLLSKELEQLPDVKPPFSLVDSILPQLAELDRSSREQSAVRAEESVVVPFSRESSRGKPSKGTSMATRTGIGAIAAAVILGIAIFNMPDKMPGAEVEQMLQDSGQATSDTANSMAIESQSSTSANSDEPAPANSGTDSAALPAEQGEDGDNAALDRAMGPVEPASMPSSPTESNAGAGARSVPEPTHSVKPNPTEKIMTPKPDTVTKVQPPDAGGGSNNPPKVDRKEQTADTDKGSASDSASSLPMEESSMMDSGFGQGLMSFNNSTDSNVQTWTSPDGQYAVEFAGLQLVIYKNSPEGSVEDRTAVTSYPLEGKWVSGEWSADNSQFTYVTEIDGVRTTKVYTVQKAGITSSAPASSPSATPVTTPAASSTN
jgi:hypothetical protein